MASAASISARRCSQAELARELGVSRQSIGELVQRHIIEVGADGLIDLDLAKLAIANRVRPSAKTSAALSPPPPPAPAEQPATAAPAADPDDANAATSFHVAKTLREVTEARIAQFKLGELKGELINVSALRTALASMHAQVREHLLQIPDRLAPVLVGQPDQAVIKAQITAEIRTVLERLTDEV